MDCLLWKPLRRPLGKACCWVELFLDLKEKCIACLFKLYQADCIDALESGKLTKVEIADVMALIGVFAPHIPTPRMLRVFSRVLNDLVPSVRLPTPDIDDSAVMAAVRHHINGDLDDASDALRPLHRKLRIIIESLMDKLPRKADRTLAEGTFVADYVSPLIHGALGIDKNVTIHFPNAESKLQNSKGSKLTVPMLLSRFEDTRSFSAKLQVRHRREVGCFEVPSSISRIPSLVATFPTLLVAQGDLRKILQSDLNERRRSWRFKDLPDLKSRVNT
ncbi:MAG: hypothetical protein J3R72DRAFT_484541 [Linnemannia gamsii]|nr:MAG: hypothetical protein J3R72DRAFT_484541 [Linnemannia gamsii]